MLFDREFLSGAIHVPAGEGIQRWVAGDMYSIKATAEQTAGTLGLVEAWVPPGAGPVAHVHNVGNEAFYLHPRRAAGIPRRRPAFTARTGDFLYVPAGTRHRFRNKFLHTARMLFLFTPGGLEASVVEGGHEAVQGMPPPVWDMARFAPIGQVTDNLGLDTDIFPEQ